MKKSLLLLAASMLMLALAPSSAYAQKAKKQKAPKTAIEIYEELYQMKSSGDRDIDAIVTSSVGMLGSFKTLSDNWVNIKIEVTEVEDQGDGITTAVTISDADGNKRTKETVKESNLNAILTATNLALEAANMGLAASDLISGIASNPARALSLAFGIKQMKLCVEAMGALGREVPVFIENVKKQNELLDQAKEM